MQFYVQSHSYRTGRSIPRGPFQCVAKSGVNLTPDFTGCAFFCAPHTVRSTEDRASFFQLFHQNRISFHVKIVARSVEMFNPTMPVVRLSAKSHIHIHEKYIADAVSIRSDFYISLPRISKTVEMYSYYNAMNNIELRDFLCDKYLTHNRPGIPKSVSCELGISGSHGCSSDLPGSCTAGTAQCWLSS